MIKKQLIFTLCLLFHWSLNISLAQAEPPSDVSYDALYRANKIHCNFLVNGVTVQTTIGIGRPYSYSLWGRMGVLLAEGKNSVGIHAMKVPEDPENAFCEMTITASVLNPDTEELESKEVTSVRVTLDEEGNFTTATNPHYPSPNLTSDARLEALDKISIPMDDEGDRNDVIVTRDLIVNHPHQSHSWSYRSTPFKDTPDNRKKLWQKYEEIRRVIGNRDEKAYHALLEPGASETEHYLGDPKTGSYTDSRLDFIREAWDAPDFQMMPINYNDYELEIYAEGRLFKYIRKKDISRGNSPIVYLKNQSERTINLAFTLINGEIVVAH